MTVDQIVKSALRVLGAIASGESPTDDETADAILALSSLVSSWSARGLKVNALTTETFFPENGKYRYTLGTGGDWDTVRPSSIEGAFIRDSDGKDAPLEIVSEQRYRNIRSKYNLGEPEFLYFLPTSPLAKIFLYPVPTNQTTVYESEDFAETVDYGLITETATETIDMGLISETPDDDSESYGGATATNAIGIVSMKPLEDLDTAAETVDFPPEYSEALKWNLAISLAPEYGASVTAWMIERAASALGRIESINFANQVHPAVLENFLVDSDLRLEIDDRGDNDPGIVPGITTPTITVNPWDYGLVTEAV